MEKLRFMVGKNPCCLNFVNINFEISQIPYYYSLKLNTPAS